jgi:hypothetical protein
MYAWILIGRALGVHPSLEPNNYEEGAALQQQIYRRQFTTPNHNGPPLAKALIRFFIDMIPFDVKERSIITIIKYFNGVENYPILRNSLQIDLDNAEDNFAKHIHQDLHAVDEEIEGLQTIHNVSDEDLLAGNYPEPFRLSIIEFFMNKLLRALFAHKRGSKSTSFQIDDALANRWGLPGNEGIPAPQQPDIGEDTKKPHPLMKFFYDIVEWLMGLVVKVREFFKAS